MFSGGIELIKVSVLALAMGSIGVLFDTTPDGALVPSETVEVRSVDVKEGQVFIIYSESYLKGLEAPIFDEDGMPNFRLQGRNLERFGSGFQADDARRGTIRRKYESTADPVERRRILEKFLGVEKVVE